MARVYVGGLPRDVRADELAAIFVRAIAPVTESRVEGTELMKDADTGAFRGFGYLNIAGEGAGDAATRCIRSYHGTRWKGCKLKVELANGGYLEKLKAEQESEQRRLRGVEGAGGSASKGNGETPGPSQALHEMSRRARAMRIRKRPGMPPMFVDPVPEVENESPVKSDREAPKSTSRGELSKDDMWASKKGVRRGRQKKLFPPSLHSPPRKSIQELWLSEEEQRTLCALKAMAAESGPAPEEEDAEVDLAFDWGRPTSGGSDSEDESDEEDLTRSQSPRDVRQQGADADAGKKKSLFDDDDDDEAELGSGEGVGSNASEEGDEFESRPQFEGTKGGDLMRLERRFGGDRRFRMDERFAEEASDVDMGDDETGGGEDTDNLHESQVQDEVKTSLGILSSMFGNTAAASARKVDTVASPAARFDPSACTQEMEVMRNSPEKDQLPARIARVVDNSKGSAASANGTSSPLESLGTYRAEFGALHDIFRVTKKPVPERSGQGKTNEAAGFSLSSLFGGVRAGATEALALPPADTLFAESEQNAATSASRRENTHFSFKDMDEHFGGSGETEDDGTSGDSKRQKLLDSPVVLTEGKSTGIWSHVGDSESMGTIFSRSADVHSLKEAWRELRLGLTHDFKKKHRVARKFHR